MANITVKLPDGSTREVPEGTTGAQFAAILSRSLAKEAAVAKIDGVLRDLDVPLTDGCTVEIIKVGSPEGLAVLRHSAAHLTAQAVRRVGHGPGVVDIMRVQRRIHGGYPAPAPRCIREIPNRGSELWRFATRWVCLREPMG